MIAMNNSLHMLCSCSSYHVMLVITSDLCSCHVTILHAHGRTKYCYAHEPNLNIDQVPPNRALFVQPQLPYGKALMRYIGGLPLRVVTKVGGYARQLP